MLSGITELIGGTHTRRWHVLNNGISHFPSNEFGLNSVLISFLCNGITLSSQCVQVVFLTAFPLSSRPTHVMEPYNTHVIDDC